MPEQMAAEPFLPGSMGHVDINEFSDPLLIVEASHSIDNAVSIMTELHPSVHGLPGHPAAVERDTDSRVLPGSSACMGSDCSSLTEEKEPVSEASPSQSPNVPTGSTPRARTSSSKATGKAGNSSLNVSSRKTPAASSNKQKGNIRSKPGDRDVCFCDALDGM